MFSNRLPYVPATTPRSLIDSLEESPLCLCGSICFATPIMERWHEAKLNSRNIVKTSLISAYADGTLCSLKCVKRYCQHGKIRFMISCIRSLFYIKRTVQMHSCLTCQNIQKIQSKFNHEPVFRLEPNYQFNEKGGCISLQTQHCSWRSFNGFMV